MDSEADAPVSPDEIARSFAAAGAVDTTVPDWLPTESEDARLEALHKVDILDTPREESFDRIARLVKRVFDVPIALVTFIDGHRQWYKACAGLTSSEVPRGESFCRLVIAGGGPIIISDATRDPRVAASSYVTGEPHVRSYLGVPLKTRDGHDIGTICAIDMKPRDLDARDVALLSDFAAMVMDEIELRQLAGTDALTGAWSRRAFREEAQRAVSLAHRHHQPLAAIGIDLDHFKKVNDAFGHAGGDAVLAESVRRIKEALRVSDVVGRLGGEEFAVVLPATGIGGAIEAAERIRAAIGAAPVEFEGSEIATTASLGVAALGPGTRTVDELLNHADRALYEAKGAGRNRVMPWPVAESVAQPLRRVLKAASIRFGGSTVDCTVRGLSEDGAGIDVPSSVSIPRHFTLRMSSDQVDKPCRVVNDTGKHLEVVFAA